MLYDFTSNAHFFSNQFLKSFFNILVPQTLSDWIQNRAYKSVENSNNFGLFN